MRWVLKAGVLGAPPFVLRFQRTKPALDDDVLGKKPSTNPPGHAAGYKHTSARARGLDDGCSV